MSAPVTREEIAAAGEAIRKATTDEERAKATAAYRALRARREAERKYRAGVAR